MKKLYLLGIVLFLACSESSQIESIDIFNSYKANLDTHYSNITHQLTSRNNLSIEQIEEIIFTEFDVDEYLDIQSKTYLTDSVIVSDFEILVEHFDAFGYSNYEDVIETYVHGLDEKSHLDENQRTKLIYFSSFYSATVNFVLNNEVLLTSIAIDETMKRPDAGECLLGTLGSGITYGISGAGVGCAIGASAGAIATAGPGAAPGCVTGASIGAVVGFIGGIFSGAADHCFE